MRAPLDAVLVTQLLISASEFYNVCFFFKRISHASLLILVVF